MKKEIKKAFKAAFPYTLPIFAGFWFLGISYGILMGTKGFSFVYPMIMSIVIFGGSLEFIAAAMLLSPFNPVATFLVSLMVQARHLFYGISMLEKYNIKGIKKLYLIYGMCDESFSINYSADIKPDVDKGWFMFFVTLLNHLYWVTGATLGGLLGSFIPFDTKGLDFAMTALFIVIFLEHWLKEKQHFSAVIGLVCTLCSRLIFGADNFLVPSMLLILILLTAFKKPLEKAVDIK